MGPIGPQTVFGAVPFVGNRLHQGWSRDTWPALPLASSKAPNLNFKAAPFSPVKRRADAACQADIQSVVGVVVSHADHTAGVDQLFHPITPEDSNRPPSDQVPSLGPQVAVSGAPPISPAKAMSCSSPSAGARVQDLADFNSSPVPGSTSPQHLMGPQETALVRSRSLENGLNSNTLLMYSRKVKKLLPALLLPLPDVQQCHHKDIPHAFNSRRSARLASRGRVPPELRVQLSGRETGH